MAPDARCTEDGPFFPPTARYLIQNGMSLDSTILKTPNWLFMALFLFTLIVILILMIIALVGYIIIIIIVNF